MQSICLSRFSFLFFILLCATISALAQAVYQDKPFVQDYSVKYYAGKPDAGLSGLACDRNGVIQVLSPGGLLHPANGHFLSPGTLLPDRTYRPMQDMNVTAVDSYDGQLVYLDKRAILSNAWAGKLFAEHQLPQAKLFATGPDFTFLVSDGKALHLLKNGKIVWKGAAPDNELISIRFQSDANLFWLLGKKTLSTISINDQKLTNVFTGSGFTSFTLTSQLKKVIIGTNNGYIEFDAVSKKQIGAIHQKLPCPEITAVAEVNGKLWFGSPQGAFALRSDGKFDYYNGERWLPGNQVTQIAAGPKHSVLILTTAGLARIETKSMTLHEKAQFYDAQVRSRHIRNGFNASLERMEKGNLATGYLDDSDNDGLWTSMYVAGEIFRYAVTKDKEALQNCRESLDALERLYNVTPVPGFPARSFERAGYVAKLHDSDRWQPSPQAGWDWKSTTSSDEVIGHVFAFGAMAELVDDKNCNAVPLRYSIH